MMTNPDFPTLKSAFETANLYNDWSTGIVVIGLVVEFLALLFFSKDMPRNEKALLVVGSILVAIGVGGEYVFSGHAANDAIALQQASDEKIAGLKRDQEADHKTATQAARSAAQLGVTVQTLPSFVGEKEGEISKLVVRMRNSGVKLDRARLEAQKAQTKAETALTVFRKEAGPRTLTADQRSRFISAIHGKMKTVLVRSVQNETESYLYAAEIMSALRDAGIIPEYNPWGLTGYLTPNRSDPDVLILEFGQGENSQAKALIDAFDAAGIRVTGVAVTDNTIKGPASAQILVAPKLPPAVVTER